MRDGGHPDSSRASTGQPLRLDGRPKIPGKGRINLKHYFQKRLGMHISPVQGGVRTTRNNLQKEGMTGIVLKDTP